MGADLYHFEHSGTTDPASPDMEDVTCLKQAVAAHPATAVLQNNLAVTLRRQRHLEESLAVYARALELDPDFADVHRNRGVALRIQGSLREAIASFRRALILESSDVRAWCELGGALRELGDTESAITAFRNALRHDPLCAEAHFAIGCALLELGKCEEGFAEQEWRWHWTGFVTPRRHMEQPRWDGRPLRGHRVLLCAEQGLGDTLQFVRFLSHVKAAGGRITLECQPELLALLRDSELADVVVETGQPSIFDFYLPLLSLPHVLGLTAEEMIPADIPYLRLLRSEQKPGGNASAVEQG